MKAYALSDFVVETTLSRDGELWAVCRFCALPRCNEREIELRGNTNWLQTQKQHLNMLSSLSRVVPMMDSAMMLIVL